MPVPWLSQFDRFDNLYAEIYAEICMEEVSPGLKVSLLIFALVLIGALGVMVAKNDELISGLDYSATTE